jgi:hypothetical protein
VIGLIHLILLRFIKHEESKDFAEKYELRVIIYMGFDTKEEVDITVKNVMNYEYDELYEFYGKF